MDVKIMNLDIKIVNLDVKIMNLDVRWISGGSQVDAGQSYRPTFFRLL